LQSGVEVVIIFAWFDDGNG
jgi:hypothetical protein